MKNLPIGVHTFERIVTEQNLYVDKTEYIYRLITTGTTYFFSRPRRFGKSLLLSTLQALFEGRRDLFEGLWLAEQTDYEFPSYHVLLLDMSKADIETPDQFRTYLLNMLAGLADRFGVTLRHQGYRSQFAELIEKIGQEKRVVVLVDEYDKPMLDHLTTPYRDEIKLILKGFYTAIKASDPYLRFVMLTGVTKFSKVSVFSDLNNLTDISMFGQYAGLLGITQAELEIYFADRTQALADVEETSHIETLKKIKYWYNGYRFSDKPVYVYNPFSLLLLLQYQTFRFHWFETGTPTFLLELIKQTPSSWRLLPEEKWATADEFSAYEVEHMQPIPLLFQSGYLTISEVVEQGHVPIYRLDYPNYEVQRAFLSELLRSFSVIPQDGRHIFRLSRYFEQGQIDEAMEELKIFFANIEYDLHLKYEKYYQTIFFAIFQLLGFNIKTEVKTNRGRVDAMVELPDTIYLFEFKLFDTASAALTQIKTAKYFQRYLSQGKEIMLIGVAFDAGEKNIGDWQVEQYA